jgi:drug/metabolite transporter (DMT)-like permease
VPTPASADLARSRRFALAALLVGAFSIGCSPIFVRLSEVGPISTAFWRLSLALLPLLAFSGRKIGQPGTALPKRPLEHLLVAGPGLILAVELMTWHLSLRLTTVANSTLFANLAPVFVALGGWLFLKQKVSRTFILALAMSLVGAIILKGGLAFDGVGHIAGDTLAVLAAALYAAYIMLIGWVRQRYTTAVIMIWGSLAASMFSLPVALYLEPAILPTTLFGWAMVFGLAWISQAGGQSLITFALAWLPVAFSSLTLLIQPVVAAALAWVLLGEALTPMQMIGGLVVLIGIFLARKS